MNGLLIQFGLDIKLSYKFLLMNLGNHKMEKYVVFSDKSWIYGSDEPIQDIVKTFNRKSLHNFHHFIPLFLLMLKNYQKGINPFHNLENDISSLYLLDREYNFKRIYEIISYCQKTLVELNITNYEFVGLSTMYDMFFHTIVIIFLIKFYYPKIKIIIGGQLFSMQHLESKLLLDVGLVDSCIFGEAEYTLPEVLNSFYKEPIRFKYEIVNDLPKLGFCYNAISLGPSTYSNWTVNNLHLNMTRGCRNRCAFCNHSCDEKEYGSYRSFGVDYTLDYIVSSRKKRDFSYLYYIDDSWDKNTVYEYTTKFLSRKLEKQIQGQRFRPNIRDLCDKETIELICKSNSNVYIGVEHFSERLLKLVNTNRPSKSLNDVLHTLSSNGRTFLINTLFLLPTETEKEFNVSIRNFLDIALKYRGALTFLNSFRLCAHTDMYVNNEKYGISFNYFPESVQNIIPELGSYVKKVPCGYNDITDPQDKLYSKKKNILNKWNKHLKNIISKMEIS